MQTFRFAAEEAKRISGETIPMDAAIGSEKRVGITFRQPIGVIAAISPFNFPLNLPAHKVAPALATGNTVVLKPAEQTPVTAFKLGELLMEAGLPPGAINILHGGGPAVGQPLVISDRVAMVTFTGSVPVGTGIRDRAGMKRVILELGSTLPTWCMRMRTLWRRRVPWRKAASPMQARSASACSASSCMKR